MSLTQRLRALSPAAQIGLAVIALVMLSGLMTAAWFSTRPRYDILFQGLRPADAATIVARLDEKKAPYRLAAGGATILVPKDQIDAMRLDIAASDLPLKGAVGFELFNKSDMGLTEFAQRINYQRALQGELARTIMTISGIEGARVHLTLPEPSVFRNDRRPPRASVTLTTHPEADLDPGAVAGIQRLVAASVADLDVSDVAVLDQSGHVLSSTSPLETEAVSPQLQQARAIEQYYAGAARATLAGVWPDSQVEVVIPVQQWGPGLTGAEARNRSLHDWSRTSRDFDIHVSIRLPLQPDADAREAMRARLVQAGVINTNDVLLFPLPVEVLPAPEEADRRAASVASPAAAVPQGRFDWRWLAAPLLVVLLLALLWRLRAPRPLSADQRAAWAQRLSRLAQGADHGL